MKTTLSAMKEPRMEWTTLGRAMGAVLGNEDALDEDVEAAGALQPEHIPCSLDDLIVADFRLFQQIGQFIQKTDVTRAIDHFHVSAFYG